MSLAKSKPRQNFAQSSSLLYFGFFPFFPLQFTEINDPSFVIAAAGRNKNRLKIETAGIALDTIHGIQDT